MVQNLLEWFLKYLESRNGRLNDFVSVYGKMDSLNPMIQESVFPYFIPLLQDGSGSLFAIWNIHEVRLNTYQHLISQPIVWLEAEANPIAVCAKNFVAFLSLLPYGGILHHYFSKMDFYLLENRTKEHYLKDTFAQDLGNCAKEYPEMLDFNKTLEKEYGISPALSPYQVFLEAYDTEPNLEEWLNQRVENM